jgi:hypothetical protein
MKEKILAAMVSLFVVLPAAAYASSGKDMFCVGVDKIAKAWALAAILVPVLVGVIPIGGGVIAVKSGKVGLGLIMIITGVFVSAIVFLMMSPVKQSDIMAVCA